MKKIAPNIHKIATAIYLLRSHRVMLDEDLAKLYGVKTKALNLAVKRNKTRFPNDFIFQLAKEENDSLRFQFETSKVARGGRRYLPYVFTEQGIAMLSSVLKSEKAIQVNIAIMRTFTKLREILTSNTELAHKLAAIEEKIEQHDANIQDIFEVIRQIINPPAPKPKGPIGFQP